MALPSSVFLNQNVTSPGSVLNASLSPSFPEITNDSLATRLSHLVHDQQTSIDIACFHNLSIILSALLNVTGPHSSQPAWYPPPRKSGGSIPGDEKNAVLYIIVVLSFYSFGIVIMMVKYMKKREREYEQMNYQDYIKEQRRRLVQERWRPLNRLALSALNTANVIPQTVSKTRRVTYV